MTHGNESSSCSCPGSLPRPVSRREMLQTSANGFGMLALSALMADRAYADSVPSVVAAQPHFTPRAKRVIFLFMDGGVSHIDSFDPKPRLTDLDGTTVEISRKQSTLNAGKRKWLGTVWPFQRRGKSGLPVSSLFPHIAQCADDLAVIRSMKGEFPLHSRGNLLIHTGLSVAGRPSVGSWVSYGLGTENRNLPGYVVLHNGMSLPSGLDNFSGGFLPASYQATLVRTQGVPIDDIHPAAGADESRQEISRIQRTKLDLLAAQDRAYSEARGKVDAIDSAIENYELAYRMQSLVPDVLELSRESDATRKLYGIDATDVHKSRYGIQCLRARRMVEAGVRFVEVTCPMVYQTNGTWDQHGGLRKGHGGNAFIVDQAIAGLIKDLKSRGLFEDTLILWAGEFGRTPHSGGTDGRDHHPSGFSVWLAGGGVKGGVAYGATDEFGMQAVENVTTFHDLHATMLHLLGLDHKRLTYRHAGRDFRLTDVYGNVVHDILA
jgi:hypothetical protein